jgi:putative DNA primase/helicase
MDFVSFARTHGLDLNQVRGYDRIYRCPTFQKPKKKNGAYLLRGDGKGWVIAYDTDPEIHWYKDFEQPLPKIDRRKWEEQQKVQRQRDEHSHIAAAHKAQELLATCIIGPANYLRLKGLGDTPALNLPDGALLIPMRTLQNELVGAQIIRWNPESRLYEKKMLPGMRAKGAVYVAGCRTAMTIILCEGYSTGQSILAAIKQMRLNAAAMVCFSASNLEYIAPQVKGRRIVFADNDQSGVGEKTAKATGLSYCMAPTVGWDCNDWHYHKGLFPVCQAIVNTLRNN